MFLDHLVLSVRGPPLLVSMYVPMSLSSVVPEYGPEHRYPVMTLKGHRDSCRYKIVVVTSEVPPSVYPSPHITLVSTLVREPLYERSVPHDPDFSSSIQVHNYRLRF